MKLIKTQLTIALLLLIVSCNSNNDPSTVSDPGTVITLDSSEKAVLENINNFSLNFYKVSSNYQQNENIDNYIISPISAAMSMTLLANACDGESREEILNAFGYDDDQISSLNALVSRLCIELPKVVSSTSTLSFANSLWIDSGFTCSEDYVNNMTSLFSAKVGNAKINETSGEQEINSWISNATNGAIRDMYKCGAADAKVAIVNALYLDAPWATAFDKNSTSKHDFYNLDGSTSKVDMVKGDQTVSYYDDNKLKAVTLHYSKSSLSYTILLPSEESSISELLNSLDEDRLKNIINSSSTAEATIIMPKVDIQTDLSLRYIYRDLGIRKIYNDNNNDFGPLGKSDLHVSSASQRNLLSISEERTVVASASVNTVGTYNANNTPNIGEVVINRPYIFIINGLASDYVLVAMGQVTKL